MSNHVGRQSMSFKSFPTIIARSSVVGPKEKEGPFGDLFDESFQNLYCERKSWEKAELRLAKEAVRLALLKAELKEEDLDFFLGGDLLNQIIIASFTASSLGVPFFGIFGACSTYVEGLILGSILVETGYAKRVMALASSHYATAQRQYRTPTEYGVMYPAYKHWTVSGAGAAIMEQDGIGPKITCATAGKIVDFGVKDAFDMGSVMAPAAADTILQHFQDLEKGPWAYDLVVTGDLGRYGREILLELLMERGVDLKDKLQDCGLLIYSSGQKVGAGGSGCGCSAVVLNTYLMQEMERGNIKRLLLVGTGALLNPVSVMQGETIPGIAHAVSIENI